MLTIRLQRAGKKNKPEYRVVLADKTAASQKKFTEVLGSYNPHTKVLSIRDQARLNYWKDEQHVELSATVHNLLVKNDIIKAPKTKAFTVPKKEVVAEEVPAEAETSAPATEETPAEASVESPAAEPVVETAPETEAPVETETPATEEAPAETPTEEKAE